MRVFMESEEFGYEEFEANNLIDAFEIIKRLFREAKGLKDGIDRKIGVLYEGKEEW